MGQSAWYRKPFLDKERNKKFRSILTKFKSLKVRAVFCKARPKMCVNGRKEPHLTLFGVLLDLTKHRYSLLAEAKSIITDNSAAMFAFADINCSLALKLNNSRFYYFNREDELNTILQKC